MPITSSRGLEGVPSKGLKVVGHYGNERSDDILILTEWEFNELHETGQLERSSYYLICKPDATKEQLDALAIQQHYLQS
jgi:hypothetical protein